MNIRSLLPAALAATLLLALARPAISDESDLCAPFRDGSVDESLVAEMLSAAKDGHLYRIQHATSRVGFCVDSSIGEVKGEFRTFNGGLSMKPATSDRGRVMVKIDASSLETGGAFIESLLKSESFFDVEQYPEIVFVSSEFRWVNRTEAVLIGELTMHGVTRQVGFHVELIATDEVTSNGGQKVIVKASTSIRRSEFGIHSMSNLASNAVNLCMTVDAVKHKS